MANFPEIINNRQLRINIDKNFNEIIYETGLGATLEQWSLPILYMINAIEGFLLWLPWYVILFFITLLTYSSTKNWNKNDLKDKSLLEKIQIIGKNWKSTLGSFLMMFGCGFIGLWDIAMATIALMVTATILAIIIGIPIGILMSRYNITQKIVIPILDIMQTLPIFVYLIPFVMIFGPGKVPALLATLVFALPPIIRLTDLGIRHVSPEVIEAVDAFGATPRQKLFSAQIPLALPTIMAGINQTTMLALSMVVIAAMIGAGGLGYQVLQGISRLEIGRGLLSGMAIVFLAIIFDRIAQSYGKKMQTHLNLNND